jgi:hypothetical protein
VERKVHRNCSQPLYLITVLRQRYIVWFMTIFISRCIRALEYLDLWNTKLVC